MCWEKKAFSILTFSDVLLFMISPSHCMQISARINQQNPHWGFYCASALTHEKLAMPSRLLEIKQERQIMEILLYVVICYCMYVCKQYILQQIWMKLVVTSIALFILLLKENDNEKILARFIKFW